MISDMEKARLNNKMLINRDWNCNKMTVDNINGRIFYQ